MSSLKNAHLTIRISPEELEEIRTFAESNGMKQSEFVLSSIRVAMGKMTGIQEQYLTLTARLSVLEDKLKRKSA